MTRHPMDDSPETHQALLERIHQTFTQFVPHNAALNLVVEDFGADFVSMRLPYAAHLVGNPLTGVLHGGAITAFLDAASGASVFMRLWGPIPIATLDLRIDYLRPAKPYEDVRCRAECYHLTKNVGFTRAIAYQDSIDRPIASAAGSFMVATKGKSVLSRKKEGES